MRSILDTVNIIPSDEKLLTDHPEINKVTEDMELKLPSQPHSETTEFAIFRTQEDLEGAVNHLVENGYTHSELSTFTSHKGSLLDHRGSLKESKIGEGLLLGIIVGALSGAIYGWSTDYQFFTPFRAFPMPRFFSLVLLAVVWGFVGGVLGLLIGRSIPEYKEEKYETNLENGTILLMVKVAEAARARLARRVFKAHGGESISPEQMRKAS